MNEQMAAELVITRGPVKTLAFVDNVSKEWLSFRPLKST